MARRRVRLYALVVALVCLLPSCSSSRYSFASNKGLGVYLKVPKSWKSLKQDELFGLYGEDGKQPSPEGFQFLKQLMWEQAWDSSMKPDVNHFVLGLANAPVARVSVRALTDEQHKTMSVEMLSNVTLATYGENLKAFKELLRNPGTADLVSADFIPLVNEEVTPGPKSNVRDGFSGVRQLFEARNTEDKSIYMIAFIGIVDDARTRMYTLTVHCNRNCYVKNEKAIEKVLDSFTVRKPPL